MQTATRRTIPFTLPWNDAPVDLRFLFENEKPAGRHGFMQAKAGRMVFEDGTVGRFWGTNFNSAANFPSHEHSEMVARRLAKFGVNLVRFHQLDGDWSTPNIFQFTKGARINDTQSLDPDSMDRLDYLIHCLKREGIYVYMDLLTYRRFRSGDAVAAADQLRNSARPYSNFDPRLIELQKQFNEQLWTHVNPYTGVAYKDEPAIVMTEISNENEVFGFMRDLIEPYRTQLQERFISWAKLNGVSIGKAPVDFSDSEPSVITFLVEVQKSYFNEMRQHMRQLGVRIPIAGTNWFVGGVSTLESQKDMDFTDSHAYWYDFTWTTLDKRFKNKTMLGERDPLFRQLTAMRVLDKPFFVSEWDQPWPSEWRAESSLLLAAVSCFQGWSGTAIHTYRYDCRENVDQIAAPITSEGLDGVAYRGGVFDTFNDPAKFGLFYHAAIMMRRGDVREPDSATEMVIPGLLHDAKAAPLKGIIQHCHMPAVEGASEASKLAVRLPGSPALAARQVPMDVPLIPPEATEIRSDTGELYRNLEKRYGTIDTSKTKVAYGFLGAAGEIAMKGLSVRASTDFAVIAISSLSAAGTVDSDNMLLTAVGRADNTGAEYNSDHTVQFKTGHGPVQVEVIEALIELETKVSGLKIWAVNPAGSLIGQVPATYKEGKLRFSIGGAFPSMYYLIQKI
ncbi:MAG TPA: hypothetical protein DET40_05265 [Lentisphaeria bacterium]|nr:MAG: hypothetical protein A2X45_21860 [Lentisphaerae bacterium GWF2_50_93]HCE42936.1 hypothetical protein [Lentisphaeria bacterium]